MCMCFSRCDFLRARSDSHTSDKTYLLHLECADAVRTLHCGATRPGYGSRDMKTDLVNT